MARIAVIDDDPAMLDLIATILVEEGYQVVVWETGKTGYASTTRPW